MQDPNKGETNPILDAWYSVHRNSHATPSQLGLQANHVTANACDAAFDVFTRAIVSRAVLADSSGRQRCKQACGLALICQ